MSHGPHAFVVEIRDRLDHQPLPGIDIGDCGDKIGFQHIDNGWISFNHFRAPKAALLNRLGDVTEEGQYISSVESEGKRFGMHIASLTGGRVNISRLTIDPAMTALVIATRYGLTRSQFGKQLLDFPLHQ